MLGHLTREQVEGDHVVRDHRLAHRCNGVVERRDDLLVCYLDLVVVGAVLRGHKV